MYVRVIKMLKILVLLTFAINYLYNIKCKQKNKIKVKIQSKFILIISAFALAALIICYKFDNTLLDEIKKINIEKKNDNLKIKIYAYGNTFIQIYDSDDEDEIRYILKQRLL